MKTECKYYHIWSESDNPDYFDAYYAVDSDGWSCRHVEVGINGVFGLASEDFEVGKAHLPEASLFPLPTSREEEIGV